MSHRAMTGLALSITLSVMESNHAYLATPQVTDDVCLIGRPILTAWSQTHTYNQSRTWRGKGKMETMLRTYHQHQKKRLHVCRTGCRDTLLVIKQQIDKKWTHDSTDSTDRNMFKYSLLEWGVLFILCLTSLFIEYKVIKEFLLIRQTKYIVS